MSTMGTFSHLFWHCCLLERGPLPCAAAWWNMVFLWDMTHPVLVKE